MNYVSEIKRLAQAGKIQKEEMAIMISEGLREISKEVKELADRHNGDWVIMIIVLRRMTEGMERNLDFEGKLLLALLDEAEKRGEIK